MNSNSSPEQLISAAMRAIEAQGLEPTSDEELQFDVDAAIAGRDQVKIYQLAPRLARLDATQLAIIRAKLQQNFGRDFSCRAFDRAIKAAHLTQKRRARGPLPNIVVTDRPLRTSSEEALAALNEANDPPALFVRSGNMVYIQVDEHDRPSIGRASEHHLRGRLDRAANFFKITMNGETHIPPPIEVVRDILALPSDAWSLPALTSLVEVPTLRPDGTILDTPGYDPQSHMFYAPAAGLETLPVPEQPTADDVDGAKSVLEEAIGEFPYADEASHANVLGLLLTPIVRPALAGCCTPLALIDAPRAGTGKSLLVDVFSVITTGRPGAMMPYPEREEEMQKQILASLIGGRPLVCFDNLEGILQSPSLALAITAKDYEARVLGVSENTIVPNNATWVVTGNNIRPSGDMPRRCYQIRLDAKMSNPFRGRTFKHPNLLGWVAENRPRLLHALLVIARYWFAAGRPAKIDNPLGSFEAWHRTVGSILEQAGVDRFLANLDTFMRDADETANQWEAFLLTLADHYKNGVKFSVAELTEKVKISEQLQRVLPDNLAVALEKKAGGFQRAIGSAFSKRREVRFGDTGAHLLKTAPDPHTKISYWKVIVPGLSDTGDDPLLLSMN